MLHCLANQHHDKMITHFASTPSQMLYGVRHSIRWMDSEADSRTPLLPHSEVTRFHKVLGTPVRDEDSLADDAIGPTALPSQCSRAP